MKAPIVTYYFIAVIFSFTIACNSREQIYSPKAFKKNQQQELDNYLTDFQEAFRFPGFAVVVIKDNHLYTFSSGKSNLEKNVPFTENTLFFTGSLSELMVANGILKLAESGKINLDDKVIKHLPYFKMGGQSYQNITIKHLLTQTSGIPFHQATWDLPNFDATALELTTKSISSQLPFFNTPGSQVKRSPYNFDILADVIEKASGQKFEDFMQQEVFKPLTMSHSTFNLKEIHKLNYVTPYQIENWLTYTVDTLQYYPKNREFAGSMGWHTSIKDLSKWMYNILHQEETKDKFYLKNRDKDFLKAYYKTGPATSIGLGWEINRENIYKKNSIGGFTSLLSLMPDKKTAIAIISNVSSDIDFEPLCYRLTTWAAGEKLPILKKPVFLALGDKLAQTHDLHSVFREYQNIKVTKLNSFDTSLDALSPLGFTLLYHLKQKDKAISFFDFCTQQFPTSSKAKLNLAEAYIINKQFSNAKQIINQLKEKDDENIDADQLTYLNDILNTIYPSTKIN